MAIEAEATDKGPTPPIAHRHRHRVVQSCNRRERGGRVFWRESVVPAGRRRLSPAQWSRWCHLLGGLRLHRDHRDRHRATLQRGGVVLL